MNLDKPTLAEKLAKKVTQNTNDIPETLKKVLERIHKISISL